MVRVKAVGSSKRAWRSGAVLAGGARMRSEGSHVGGSGRGRSDRPRRAWVIWAGGCPHEQSPTSGGLSNGVLDGLPRPARGSGQALVGALRAALYEVDVEVLLLEGGADVLHRRRHVAQQPHGGLGHVLVAAVHIGCDLLHEVDDEDGVLKVTPASVEPLVDLGSRHALEDARVGLQDALAQLVVVVDHVLVGVLQLAGHASGRAEHLKGVRHVRLKAVCDLEHDIAEDGQNLRLDVPVHLAVDEVTPQDGHDLFAVRDEVVANGAGNVADEADRRNADLPVLKVLQPALEDGVERLHVVVELLAAGHGERAHRQQRLVEHDAPVVEDGDEGAHQLVRALQHRQAGRAVLRGVLHRQLLDDDLQHAAEVALQLVELLRVVGAVGGHDDGLQLLDDDLHELAEDEDGVAARVAHEVVDGLEGRHGEVGAVGDGPVGSGQQQSHNVLEVWRQWGLRLALVASGQLADGEAGARGDGGGVGQSVLQHAEYALDVRRQDGHPAVDALQVQEDLTDAPQRGVPHVRVFILGGHHQEAEPLHHQRLQLRMAGAVQDGAKRGGGCLAPPPVLGGGVLADVALHKRHDARDDVVAAAGGQQGDARAAGDRDVPDAVVALAALLLLDELRQQDGHQGLQRRLGEVVVHHRLVSVLLGHEHVALVLRDGVPELDALQRNRLVVLLDRLLRELVDGGDVAGQLVVVQRGDGHEALVRLDAHLLLRAHAALADDLHDVVALVLLLKVLVRKLERVAQRGGGGQADGEVGLLLPHAVHHSRQDAVDRLLVEHLLLDGRHLLADVAQRVQRRLLQHAVGRLLLHVAQQIADQVGPLVADELHCRNLRDDLRRCAPRVLPAQTRTPSSHSSA
mmetsp:Transcript_10598/g.27224  ORF Transcript_10598/g.27224 Transcript_10598/m.27224 type:complete len:857 (-) Transcript_10598:238-2808(-)